MTECIYFPKPYPLGAHAEKEGIRFSFASSQASCGVILYDKKTGKQLRKEAFTQKERIGKIYSKYIEQVAAGEVSYLFYEDDRPVPDPYAKAFWGKHGFGKKCELQDFRAIIPSDEYDWQGDRRPALKMQDSLCYCMHVRGFTAHASSGVKHRGTFSGIIEKIPYLKEIGVTTLELQPAYEFTELPAEWESKAEEISGIPSYLREKEAEQETKLNYWGYKKAFYYAPKSAYSYSGDAVGELKNLVRELHANGMELIMQFYFPADVKVLEIPELLRYWVLEYHIDGFHLMGVGIPADMIAADDLLSDTKLWYDSFDTDSLYGRDEAPSFRNLAFYRDEYLYTMRRFLKGDEGMQESVLYQMRHIPEKAGRVHYLTNYNGFTLMDLVSYDHKHNEANGEANRDGNDYNCSWNCGEEGVSRKTKVKTLRIRQIKNAMCLLMFTQSTPLIFMGDEFGNTQKGNNNPYCQDNLIAWLDWNQRKKNEELTEFWKQLVQLRREHPILRPENELRLMDYIGCGYPDLSYHGQSAWRPQTEYFSRHVGVMFCGKYARKDRITEDDFLYLAMNMHWEKHELALPKLPQGMDWKLLLTTDGGKPGKTETTLAGQNTDSAQDSGSNICMLNPRSISVYVSVQEDTKKRKSRKEPINREKRDE